jgi:glycosyltransferase involved in cell wall biosynthesis
MVSVCMATFNGANFISEQIESILQQLDAGDELIISDDGSTDDTIDIIKYYNDKRVKLFVDYQPRNLIRNFGYALSKAKGDYIFLCDQDDVWFLNKVEVCTSLLKDYDLVVSDCLIVDDGLNSKDGSYIKFLNAGPGLFKNLKKNTFLGCCMCFKKSMLNLLLPFPKDIPMHDIWIGFVASLFGKVKFEEQMLVMYRRHNETVTHQTVGKSTNNLWGKLLNRFNLIKYIPLLIKRRML